MAAPSAIEQLRGDTGHSITSLSDVDAQAILDEAGAVYTDAPSAYAYARLVTLRRLTASASKMRDYTANNSQEKASQVFDHVFKLLAYWDGKLTDAVAAVDAAARPSAARFGRTKVLPSRLKEWPGW